jgi:hypothetical protein
MARTALMASKPSALRIRDKLCGMLGTTLEAEHKRIARVLMEEREQRQQAEPPAGQRQYAPVQVESTKSEGNEFKRQNPGRACLLP